ncbi:hypothetical protein BT96DRAFT_915834 [Gymnopus androsaceus JB14]|uniref:Nephrocystin 3-like N-terminal domain-containing protein n=1 Tax=Gymnopus androsaceus JB14 TaxID=1447944 RepID=A0A6A4I584_9AGAR|nr:hypothetical protein BT96DRAFT_915834 [Gymnopus androsaceus JB14]
MSFANAQKFTVNSPSFISVAGDYIQREERDHYYGLEILCKDGIQGASYNSEQRFPPPNCHPGTRTQVLEILGHWITDIADRTPVHWLYGAAGVGKSALLISPATFFFARADPLRNNLTSFLITIAYQLATSPTLGPLLKYPIDTAVRENPDIVHAILEEQFRDLIMRPCIWLTETCRLTTEQWRDFPRLIVIDGLDECVDIASQERLLSIIRKAKTATPSLPFKFLICSRPEPPIGNAFRHQDFHPILDCTDIGESFESGKDIARFLQHEFSKIRQKHRSMTHVAEDWPGNGVIQQLVQKACGQFIYAATVIKYVGDYDGFPIERLEIILKITLPDDFDSPYPDLDLLYMQILSVCPKTALFFDVIAHILRPADTFFDNRFERTSSSRIIEGLFFLPKGKVWALLSRLHSVLFIPENDHGNITVRHASFIDFLTDRRRSGKYFINTDIQERHERVLFYLLKIIPRSHFESGRILTALNEVDLVRLLNTTLLYKNTTVQVFIDTLQSCLENFRSVVQWAHALRQSSKLPIFDLLIKQYRLFDFGFRISIPSSLKAQAKEILTVVILALKTRLIGLEDWYDKFWVEMAHSLLTCLPDPPQLEIRSILNSPVWPVYLSIFPLNMNPLQFHYDLWNKSGPDVFGPDIFTMIPINYMECHKEIGLHCIWILSRMPYHDDVIFRYAKCQWINHILNVLPSDEMLQVLLDNVALLNKEDVRRALEWAEGAMESQDKHTQQLIMRIRRHLKPLPIEGTSNRSQSGGGADSESVNERASQNEVKPSSGVMEKPTKSVVVNRLSENKVKHRWIEKLFCF